MSDRLPGTTYDNPVWHRNKWRIYLSDSIAPASMRYEYVHDDYDGAPDANDSRCGHEASIDACKQAIDDTYDDDPMHPYGLD